MQVVPLPDGDASLCAAALEAFGIMLRWSVRRLMSCMHNSAYLYSEFPYICISVYLYVCTPEYCNVFVNTAHIIANNTVDPHV